MFLPYFIALMLGLINPSTIRPDNDNTPVYVTTDGDEEPEDDGSESGGSGDTPPVSGENGNIKPPKR